MIANRLRAAILQAAISGKLTDQRPEDGTATELLEQIKAERAALVKAGKLKKRKPLPLVTEDEKQLSVPANWMWSRLGDVALPNPRVNGNDAEQIGFLPMASIEDGYTGRIHPQGRKWSEVKSGFTKFAEGDVVMAKITPCFQNRKSAIVRRLGSQYGAGTTELHVLRPASLMEAEYLLFFLKTEYVQDELTPQMTGTAGQKRVPLGALTNLPIPVPPLAEQGKIVAKLHEVLPLIDQLAELEREKEYLDREFAKAIERAILQAAISGKLTDQRPEDGTATELLEQIKAERAALVKAKKLQKQKVLQPVTEESQPFVIPASWEWVRFQDVNQFRIGKTPKRAEPKFWSPSEVPWVSISDMTQGGSIASTKEGVSAAAIAECFGGQTSPAGTLIMSFKLTIGRCSFLGRDAVHNEAIVSIFPAMSAGESFSTYLSHALPLLSQLGDSKAAIKGNTLNSKSIANLPIPLPPPMEQERIAAKLDRALPLARGLGELVS